MNLRYRILRLLGYKTQDELFRELHDGRRQLISTQDLQKSAELVRALYPKGIRYPQAGEVYVCIKEAPITYMTHWLKPYTGGEKAIFPKDEKIIISDIRQLKPTSVYCEALNVEAIEELLVPQTDREQYDYNGYSLMIDTLTLNLNFKLVED